MRIGVDIGGTKSIVALIDDDARILRRQRVDTGINSRCRDVIGEIAQIAKEIAGDMQKISFIGIGIPGTVDAAGKTAVYAPNIGWFDEPVAAYFESICGVAPYLAQDTRAAAWAEARRGEMKRKRCVVCVTLGTGIGCGIVLNHRIWHGALGTAGEVGHIPVVADGRQCNCGRRGCLEAYASGTGLARTARERGICDTAEALFALAEKGGEQARRVIDEAVGYVAAALTAVINVLSPDAVLFSGGLSAQEALYVRPIIARIRETAYQNALGEELYLGPAFLNADAPVIGAAFLDETLGGVR
jgi:glucokinase